MQGSTHAAEVREAGGKGREWRRGGDRACRISSSSPMQGHLGGCERAGYAVLTRRIDR